MSRSIPSSALRGPKAWLTLRMLRASGAAESTGCTLFDYERARHSLALETAAAPRKIAGADRHEEDVRLPFPLKLDLAQMRGLDLDVAGFDLAKPDRAREFRRLPGALVGARGLRL